MDKIDTQKMRTAAEEIETQLKTFRAKMTDLDEVVAGLQWKDVVKDGYVSKYESDAKSTEESVYNVMKSFSELLIDSADVFEQHWSKAQNGL